MIRAGSIRAQVDHVIATLRGRRDAILGAHAIEIHPSPDERDGDSASNTEVLHYLGRRYPGLLAVRGGDVDALVREAVRVVWRPRTSTLRDLAVAAGPAFARAVAARLRSGAYVTNTEETSARKARAGHGTTPGVETGQLADALDHATINVL